MRPSKMPVRAALCALALALMFSPAVAGPKKGKGKKAKAVSVAYCTSFDQVDREDEGVDLVVSSRCEMKLACSVSWSLTCRPAVGKSRRSQHGEAFSLVTDASTTTNANAAVCGNDGWEIDNVSWSCAPDASAPPAVAAN